MAKIRFRDWSPKLDTMERILKINSILGEYQGRVSVRQLYYRLVAAGIIPNKDDEYQRVQDLVTKARYAGLIDWGAIEDRNREPMKSNEWADGRAALNDAAGQFRLDRWATQPFYVELWVEKAALAGVLWPICQDYHITLMVNRGYSSASAMKESADRIRWHIGKVNSYGGQRPVILYIGDHDPSGKDMIRDIGDRLREFGCPSHLDVRPVALTRAQIDQYNPPPNPAKITDSRAAEYIAEHGEYSWEVDALPPDALNLLVRQVVSSYIDKDAMKKAITRENMIKQKIKEFTGGFKDVP